MTPYAEERSLWATRERNNHAAERTGFTQGRGNFHYLPALDYATSGEWLAWLRGWRRGQEIVNRSAERLIGKGAE